MAILRDKITTPIFTQATLGGRSEFEYTIENGNLLLRFGRMNYFLIVKNEIIEAVKERIVLMKRTHNDIFRYRTSLYNQPKWEECPNNRFSVYVACLIINNKIN